MEEVKTTTTAPKGDASRPPRTSRSAGAAYTPRRDGARIAQKGDGSQPPRRGTGGRGPRKDGGRSPRERVAPEFETKMISIRRVTRVVAGGRRFTLSVAVVSGDRKGRIGLGTGKSIDTQLAIEKASKVARKNMMTLKLSKNRSLPHDVEAKYGSAKVMLMPNAGKGLIAGSSARAILAIAGVSDVTAKFNSGTKNKLNNARATMKALSLIAYKKGEEPVASPKPEQKEAETAVTEEKK